jgi:hypothetical protein
MNSSDAEQQYDGEERTEDPHDGVTAQREGAMDQQRRLRLMRRYRRWFVIGLVPVVTEFLRDVPLDVSSGCSLDDPRAAVTAWRSASACYDACVLVARSFRLGSFVARRRNLLGL